MARGRQGGGDSVPHNAKIALLIIDMISDFEFEDGDRLLRGCAAGCTSHCAAEKASACRPGASDYVNDNFGQWRSDFRQLLDHCLHAGVAGESVARLLAPDAEDYFVLKPTNSGFFELRLRRC